MTDRLSPTDAGFLYTEDATTPMHVGGVAIVEPNGVFDYSDIVRLIEQRLSLVPRYRQKVRFVPGRIARPVWVDDESFDLTYHVRRSALPRPGTKAQLEELVGRLISRPLDRNRPLWELYVVEGLENGRVALVNKTHYAMVDRAGAVDVAAAILDTTPEPRPLPGQVWTPTPPPSEIDLVVDALADIAARPNEVVDAVRLAALDVRSTISDVGQLANGVWQIAYRAVRPAPRSTLNVTVSGQRRFAGVAADLARLKAIRTAHGGTINDVILGVITGALRSFLLSRGEPVSAGATLRAMVPVSIRGTDDLGRPKDLPRVASFLIDLPIAEPNPVIRLHQVSYAMSEHNESTQRISADSLMELGRFAPATLHTLGARVGSQLGRRLYNLMITNVPGPQVPLYAAGMHVAQMYPVAPLAKGQALALSVTSYNGRVFFGLTADREAVPDLSEFTEQLHEAIDEFPLPPPTRAPRVSRRMSPAAAGTGDQRLADPKEQAGEPAEQQPEPHPPPATRPSRAKRRVAPRPKAAPPRPRARPTGVSSSAPDTPGAAE